MFNGLRNLLIKSAALTACAGLLVYLTPKFTEPASEKPTSNEVVTNAEINSDPLQKYGNTRTPTSSDTPEIQESEDLRPESLESDGHEESKQDDYEYDNNDALEASPNTQLDNEEEVAPAQNNSTPFDPDEIIDQERQELNSEEEELYDDFEEEYQEEVEPVPLSTEADSEVDINSYSQRGVAGCGQNCSNDSADQSSDGGQSDRAPSSTSSPSSTDNT